MTAFGKRSIRTIETPDEIQFFLVRESGWANQLIGATVVLLISWQAWRSSNPLWYVLCILGWVSLAADRLFGKTAQFGVTQTQLTALGAWERIFQERFEVGLSEVKLIGYAIGGEGDPYGFYISAGWQSKCVLPGIDEADCRQIMDAIYRKFPDIEIGNRDGSSLLFKDDGGIVRLGLNKQ